MEAMQQKHAVGLRLFQALDSQATALEATTGDMLDVAAVILAHYMLQMRDELGQRHYDPDSADFWCWEALKDRARMMALYLENGTVQ